MMSRASPKRTRILSLGWRSLNRSNQLRAQHRPPIEVLNSRCSPDYISKKRTGQGSELRKLFLLFALCVLNSELVAAGDYPRGFFVEDLRQDPPVPAFYNLDSHSLDPFVFRQTYSNFI